MAAGNGYADVTKTESGRRELGDRDFIAGLARGLAVIRAFDVERTSLTVAEASRIVGLPRATVRRILLTLCDLGYAGSDGKFFWLMPRIVCLGYAYLVSTPLPQATQPILQQVTDDLDESTSLSILDGVDILYMGRAAARRIMMVSLFIGNRLPAYCTSMGRVLLASLPESEVGDILARSDRRAHTRYTLTHPDDIRRAIAEVREQGYAISNQELELGLRSIAVPVRDGQDRVVAALNLAGSVERCTPEFLLGRGLPVLRDAAEELRLSLSVHRVGLAGRTLAGRARAIRP